MRVGRGNLKNTLEFRGQSWPRKVDYSNEMADYRLQVDIFGLKNVLQTPNFSNNE